MRTNNSNNIVKAKDLDISKVRISSPRDNNRSGKAVYINYIYEDGSSPKPLRVRMPRLVTPFGISGWDNQRPFVKGIVSGPTENSNDSIEFSINDENSDIIKKFEELDNLIIQHGIDNSKELFNKKLTPERVTMFYKNTIKHYENEDGVKDNKYPPNIKAKLFKNKTDYSYITRFFDEDKNKVKIDIFNYATLLPKRSECISILECGGIWIVNDKFGITWRPAQIKIFKSNNDLDEYAIDDEDEDESPKKDCDSLSNNLDECSLSDPLEE